MAKIVKKTYSKKFAWETGSSRAFDDAKMHSSKRSPAKLVRPSIWAKVPLIETFTTESPPRPKKRTPTGQFQDPLEVEKNPDVPKKGKKRKFNDPFGFDDEVVPASEYISPKKIKKLDTKKVVNGSKGSIKKDNLNVSPKKRGRPPTNQLLNQSKDKNNLKKTASSGISASPGPKKRGRPPKNSLKSPIDAVAGKNSSITSEKREVASSPSPKKRGRPPKDKTKSPDKQLPVTPTVKKAGETAVSASPKKRGRPLKNQSPGSPMKLASKLMIARNFDNLKKQGKLQKSPNKVAKNQSGKKVALSIKGSNASPRKRGRPPKSPNTSSLNNSSKNLDKSDDNKGSKKGVKSPKSPSTATSISSGHQSSSSNVKANGTTINPVTKKRGRPPKVPSSHSQESISRNNSDLARQKSSHSKVNDICVEEPSSTVKSPSKSNTESTVKAEGVMQVSDGAPLIKRKRGRPPKKKLVPAEEEKSRANSSQETLTADSINQPCSSNLSTEANLFTDEIEPARTEVDTKGFVDQVLVDETTKEVRVITDPNEAGDGSETASRRPSILTGSGSPFKWFLRNNEKTLSPRKVAQLRRMSVLPTCTPNKDDGEDDNDSELDSIPFSLSWAMQQDENTVRVKKDDKELFTIVRNTKQAQESVEFGESQQFKDDIEYLLDGISEASSLSTRCLSLIELASKCSKSAFRMNLRAHGTITVIFQRLDDAMTNQNLALCTATVMFMLTRDRLSIDFDKSILEIMLKLLTMKDNTEENPSKEWDRLTSKIRALFEKHEIKGVNNLDLSKLTIESLARESLLSLTLQRTGSWFKDEIRLLGGLDHVVDTVVSCSTCLKVDGKAESTQSPINVRQIERCFRLLENVTVQCQNNQGYLISYRESALLETCARLLQFSVASLIDGNIDSKTAIQALWFSTMKMLLNLTHDNELASSRFCQKNNVLSILLKSALQLPNYLPLAKQFDVVVLSLGLLINLVEYSKKNLEALNAAVAPPLQSGSQAENTSFSEKEDASAVDLLMHLFLVRLEAAKDNSGMEEDLTKLNSSLHNSSIRIGSDGLSVVCGDDLDKSENEENAAVKDGENEEKGAPSEERSDSKPEENCKEEKSAADKESEQIGKALQKAGQHMEDSLMASYAALLLGLLCEDSNENQQIIHEKLQYGDFGIMTHTLEKFLAFMNMTASSSGSSSSLVIKRAIGILEQCKSKFPTNFPAEQKTASVNSDSTSGK